MTIFRFILVFILSSQFAFADMCEYFYKYNFNKIYSTDLVSVKKLNILDDLTFRLKKFNNKKIDVETEILKGNSSFAIGKWSSLFRKVESSALYVNNYTILNKGIQKGVRLNVKDYEVFLRELKLPQYLIDQHLPFIYKYGPEDYLPILMKKMRKQAKVLGNNYNTYKQARNSLDNLVNSKTCNSKCQHSIKEIYETIGITAKPEREIFRHLIKNRKKIKFSTIEKVFNNHPQSLVIAKRKEFLNQAVKLLKKIYGNAKIMRSLYRYLSNVSASKGLKISRLFKRLFDRRAFDIHNKVLTKVSYSDLPIKEKLVVLKNETKGLDFDSVLADMSRHSDSKIKEVFNELVGFAKKSKTRTPLLKQLDEAKVLGKKLGSMSNSRPKNLGTLITGLVVGGVGIAYFTFDIEKQGEIGQTNGSDSEVEILDDVEEFEEFEDTEDDIIYLKFESPADESLYNELESIIEPLGPFIEKISP